MSLAGQALRGALAGSVTQGLRWILQIISLVILARLLSPGDYGFLAMILALVGIGEVLRDLGLSTAAVQAKQLNDQQRSNLFWANVVIGLALGGLIAFAAAPIASLYGHEELNGLTLALATIFPINGFATQFRAHLVRELRFVSVNAADLLAQVCGLGVAISCAVGGAGYWSLALQQIAQSFTLAVMVAVSAHWLPSRPRSGAGTKSLLRFGTSYAATQLIVYGSTNASSVLLGVRFGAYDLGIFNRAQQVCSIPLAQVTAAATQVAVPVLSKLQEEEPRYRRYWATSQVLMAAPISVLYGVLIAFAAPLVPHILGSQWRESADIIAILAAGTVFQILSLPTFWFFVTRDLVNENLKFSITTRTILTLATVAAATGGLKACAIVTAVGALGMWIAGLLWIARWDTTAVRLAAWNGVRVAALGLIPAAATVFARTAFGAPEEACALVFLLSFATACAGCRDLVGEVPEVLQLLRVGLTGKGSRV